MLCTILLQYSGTVFCNQLALGYDKASWCTTNSRAQLFNACKSTVLSQCLHPMQCSVLNSARFMWLSVQSPAADSVTTERVGLLCRGPQLQHSDYTLATQLLSLQNLICYQAIAAAEKTSPKSTVALGLWKKWQTSCPKSYCHSLCSQLSAVSLWLSPKWHSISYGNWSNLVQFLLHLAVILLSTLLHVS